MSEDPYAPNVSFTATGRHYMDHVNLLARQIPGTPDRTIVGIQTALRGAFDAVRVTAEGADREFTDRSFSASANVAADGSFELRIVPGDVVSPEFAREQLGIRT